MDVRTLADYDIGQRAILDRLVRERVEGDYAYFFVTGEGELMADGVEEASGCVIDRQGRVFSFWLGWDSERQAAALTEWEEVKPEAHWSRSREYRRARAAVGLASD
jgi:hypothetical protein